MIDRRKRGPAGTLQRQVWQLLRDRGPQTAQQLADALGADRETCRRACLYLVARGRVERVGAARRHIQYGALGTNAPADLRGKRMASRNHRGARAWKNWLRMMRQKHGPSWTPPPRGCALAERWRGSQP